MASGRIKSGEVIEGTEILPAKAPLTAKPRDIFAVPPGLGFSFGKTSWSVTLRTFDTDVKKILADIDDELERLGCLEQRRRDGLNARWIPAALPTAEYSVVAQEAA